MTNAPGIIQSETLIKLNSGLILIALFFSTVGRMKIAKSSLIGASLTILAFSLPAGLIGNFTPGVAYQIFLILGGIAFVHYYGIMSFVKIFSRLLFYLCVASIILYILVAFNASVISVMPRGVNSSGEAFTTIFFASMLTETQHYRISSIFREPGVFASYIIISIIIDMKFRPQISLGETLCKILALLLTLSTLAYIFIFCYLFIKLLKNLNVITILFSTAMIFVAIILYQTFPLAVFEIVFGKFLEDSVAHGSTIARTASILVNFEMFKSSPFFGVGLDHYQYYFGMHSFEIFRINLNSETMSTNTIMSTLGVYGAFTFMVVVLFIYLASKTLSDTLLGAILVLLILSLTLSTQDFRYSAIFAIILGIGTTWLKNLRIMESLQKPAHVKIVVA